MQDAPFENESVEFEVKPRTPRLPGRMLGLAAVGVAIVIVAGLIGAALVRTAASSGDPVARVMPSNVMLYFSMATHPEQAPNYAVVAEAWRGSKEAKQIEDALRSALTFSGFDWDKDIAPWLGDRVGVGVVDLGGPISEDGATDGGSMPNRYRNPFIIVAAHTRDRAKSDAFLAEFRSQRESSLRGNSATYDEVYRGVPIVYVANDMEYLPPYGEAYATIDDVVVLAVGGRDDLKQVIDAALDGADLAASSGYQAAMNALPAASVGATYLDYARYFDAIESMITSRFAGAPDAGAGMNQQLEDQRRRLQAQWAQLRQITQATGGMGAVMTYEPGGIRFDFAMQVFPERLPQDLRDVVNLDLPAAANHIFESIPSSAILVGNMSQPAASWSALLNNPGWLDLAFGAWTPDGKLVSQKLADFQKAAGIDLKADFLNLFDGEAAVVLLPAPPGSIEGPGYRPFDVALMFDSSDPDRAALSLDKLIDAIARTLPDGSLQRQPLSGLPYTVVLNSRGDVQLAYGVIGGRLVLGTGSNALLAVQTADQSPLSASDVFKSAMAGLPAQRVMSGFVRMEPFLKLLAMAFTGSDQCGPCNYLQPIQWISSGGEVLDKDAHLQRATLHVALEPAQ